MAQEVDFLDQTRVVPETPEDDWGDDVTGQLVDLLAAGDFAFFRIAGNFGIRIRSGAQTLIGGGTIAPSAPVMKLTAASAITVGGIADGVKDDQLLILRGTSATNTVRLNHGSNCQLNGDVVLGLYDSIMLQWDEAAGDWLEVTRSP